MMSFGGQSLCWLQVFEHASVESYKNEICKDIEMKLNHSDKICQNIFTYVGIFLWEDSSRNIYKIVNHSAWPNIHGLRSRIRSPRYCQ